ncbi:hypothetical protein [Lentzea kentuckyensis]|uniref:hypothetical protein n=1 Tax=Lentzea kentuckyensis TaxID=360086 RepID=UPI00117B93EC|nr:hypothetical protein [Lentzea kentuckyensis]
MTAFSCGACGVMVTVDLVEIPFPGDAGTSDEHADPQPRVRQGTFVLDPDPFGPPLEPLPDNAQVMVSAGPRGTILVHPDDVLGLRPHTDASRLHGCCRFDGLDGPNLLACDGSCTIA